MVFAMKYSLKSQLLSEIIIRLFIWGLFILFDKCDPFIREIQEEEVWKYKYPATPSYIPGPYLWVLIVILPLILFAIDYLITGKLQDIINGILVITLAYSLNGLLTSFLKVIVGRPRPDFHYRCFPDGKGTDYTKCNGSRDKYLDGRKSFPSGHSSFSFCCMLFITMYIIHKFKQGMRPVPPHAFRLCIYFFPLLAAGTIAISRTCDYHHHYEDVIAGSIFGTVLSYASFRLYFGSDTITSNSNV